MNKYIASCHYEFELTHSLNTNRTESGPENTLVTQLNVLYIMLHKPKVLLGRSGRLVEKFLERILSTRKKKKQMYPGVYL